MEKGNKEKHKHIQCLNPDVISLEQSYQDFFKEINTFNAGDEYENFNDFIKNEAIEYKSSGDGVTYIVWNVICDENKKEKKREIIAFYTLAATSIPYEDRIRLDEDEVAVLGKEFDIEVCGIPSVEIKMFAMNEKYQDVFFEYEGEDLPVSAWIIRSIIDYANSLINEVIGFKAIFLHSLPEAEQFYIKNGFHNMEINMQPLHCVDSEFKPMYLTLKNVYMNYDE